MHFASIIARAGGCAFAALVAGCQVFGPASLRDGRVNYNRAIEDTQKVEVFSNFIRTLNQEPTLFLSVAEIDASGTVQTSVSPQVSNIGVGMKTGNQLTGPSMAYTEQPIIKYVPLSGQELVAQITTPITAQSLTNLLDSDWNLVPVLQLTIDRMTPQFADQGAALNAIAQLNDYKALVLTSIPGGLRLYLRPDNPSIAPVLSLAPGAIGAGETASAEIAARRNILHLWTRLLRIYEDTQTAASARCQITTADDACLKALDAAADKLDRKALEEAFAHLPAYIDLNTQTQTGRGAPLDRGPILHTRSALGSLKAIVRAGGSVREFKMDIPAQAQALRDALDSAARERHDCLLWPNYYVFAPSVQASSQGPDYTEDQNLVAADVRRQKCVAQTLRPSSALDVGDFRTLRRELMLFASRAFILFESAPDEPADAYVTYYDNGRWYYIDNEDGISKQNLLLLSQLLTMQAVPTKTETNPVALTLQ